MSEINTRFCAHIRDDHLPTLRAAALIHRVSIEELDVDGLVNAYYVCDACAAEIDKVFDRLTT